LRLVRKDQHKDGRDMDQMGRKVPEGLLDTGVTATIPSGGTSETENAKNLTELCNSNGCHGCG
jgi:hypothetical protein